MTGAGLLLAAWGGVACGSSTKQSNTPLAAGSSGGAARQAVAPVAAPSRQVISTATLRVEVRDVAAATARAAQLAGESGGFLAGSDESGAPGQRRAQVTLKVPGERFDRLVGALAGLGELRSKQVSTEDVTDQVVDLEARLSAARASADRLQQLIAKSASVTEVVGVEAELAKRTAETESLEGRLRVVRDKVDLATVMVSFSPPQPSADEDLPGFLTGLRGGWRALRATVIVGSAVLGALLPWLVPAALLAVAARLAWKRWRRAHPPRSKPPPRPPGWPSGVPPTAAAPAAHPPPTPGPPPVG